MKRLLMAVALCAVATSALARDNLFDSTSPGFVVVIDPASPANALGTASHPFNFVGSNSVSSQYPLNSVPETISATGTTTAFSATLPVGTASQTVYICGAEIDAVATAGVAVAATITGTKGGTLNFLEFVTTPANAGNGRNVYAFNPCIPASAVNTAILINAGAAGTAGVATISAWGYLL